MINIFVYKSLVEHRELSGSLCVSFLFPNLEYCNLKVLFSIDAELAEYLLSGLKGYLLGERS